MLRNELPAAASAHIGGTCCEVAVENLRLGLGQRWKELTWPPTWPPSLLKARDEWEVSQGSRAGHAEAAACRALAL